MPVEAQKERRDVKVRNLAKTLLFDLTQLPGESSEDEKRLGRAIVRFLTRPHLAVDALLDPGHSPAVPESAPTKEEQ